MKPYEHDFRSVAELIERGARVSDFTTGKPGNGAPEVIRFIDDGYRIYATWSGGGPVCLPADSCVMVAEYKHCDFPSLGYALADALMKAT
jgi:hypothetical protein